MSDEVRKGSSIGQFDLIKGVGILCIVIKHSLGLFPLEQMADASWVGVTVAILIRIFNNMMMPAFFVISGFGFRKEDPIKSIKKQTKYLILPYGIVMLITSASNLLIHYVYFHDPGGAVLETAKVFGGFLLGAATNLTIGNTMLFANGACWYLLALFLAWNLLQVIFRYVKGKHGLTVAVVVLAGWGLGVLYPECPFGIPQAMIAVGYLYMGYQIKKKRWLFTPLSAGKCAVLVALSLIAIVWGDDVMADNQWKLGIVGIIADAAYAAIFIRLILKLNQYKNPIFSALSYLGRMSLWIICLHTIEFIAIPWYLYDHVTDNTLINLLLIIAVRSIIIAAGMYALKMWSRFRKSPGRKNKIKMEQ